VKLSGLASMPAAPPCRTRLSRVGRSSPDPW
jgi:hypothetical protein